MRYLKLVDQGVSSDEQNPHVRIEVVVLKDVCRLRLPPNDKQTVNIQERLRLNPRKRPAKNPVAKIPKQLNMGLTSYKLHNQSSYHVNSRLYFGVGRSTSI